MSAMTAGRGDMADVRGMLARYLRDHAGAILLTCLALMALGGGIVMIYGAGDHSKRVVQLGGDYIVVGVYTAITGLIGYWAAMRKRRIHVEDELADLQETLLRIEQTVGGGKPAGVVRPLHRG
jgi:hypothetical protein